MIKPKIVRLIIYLVISIGLIVLLFNIPRSKPENKEADSVSNKNKLDTSSIDVQLTDNDSLISESDAFEIGIDSLGNYQTSTSTVNWNELKTEISVQKKIRPKLYLKINVNSHSNSEVLMNLIEFASKEKIKISITKN